MANRIIFSNATPNDQGGIIPNNVIDFTRFNKNPVLLKEHQWGELGLGLMTEIKEENGNLTGLPVFHGITEDSQKYGEAYEKGFVRAASIGGHATWKTNNAGQYVLDKDGNRICEHFDLYEISIVSLPSNPDAVTTLSVKFYEKDQLNAIDERLTTLSAKFNSSQMAETKKPEEQAKAAPAANENTPTTAAATTTETKTELSAEGDGLPKWLKNIIQMGGKVIFGAGEQTKAAAPSAEAPAVSTPTPKDLPESKPGEPLANQPGPTGLSAKAEKAKEKAEKAREAAEKAVKKAQDAKTKAESDDATDDQKAEYKKALDDAEEAMKAYEAAEAKFKKLEAEEEEDDDDEEETKNSAKPEKTTNSAAMKPEKKTPAELRADLNLAAEPKPKAKVLTLGSGVSFTKLSADKAEGERILHRVMTSDAGEKHLDDYAVVLNSILNDGRLSALKDKVRFIMNAREADMKTYQDNPNTRAGISMQQLAAQLNSGSIEMMGRDNVMRPITKLNSSDDALASPALTAIEWLPLAIFKLFPTTSWKNEIAIFGATETGNNLGVIWTNIAADPAIYKGNQPANPSNYSYTDTAVALKLVPYWLQPMMWTPLTMHMLRYDQMGTGWSQAFAKWGAVMDDDMLYTLASTVPQNAIIQTSGGSFNIAGANDPNSFIYNPAFTGNLKKPVLNDIIASEQIYNRQNFQLAGERAQLVIDPTMDRYIAQDPETKSLLTRWVNADGGEMVKFKNTTLNQRSRVAIYDPATGQVKDPGGVIPSTAVSAGVGFIPSQVGMGLGMLDVFMIQDPSAYGYKMSADIRIGIVPLRADFSGTSLYVYGDPNV